jgi:hypothetical protein
MSSPDGGEIRPLNETMFSELSIEELESRLQMEELDPRGEMWTGCGCADEGCRPVCAPEFGPDPGCPIDCPPVVCGWRGTY